MPQNQRQQAMYVTTGDPESVNDSPSKIFAIGQVGRYLTVKQPGVAGTPGAEDYRDKVYRYVWTDSSMTVAPYRGAVAWWANKAVMQVTTNATNRAMRAGVFQGPITPGNYGFIQTGGPATVKFVDAPVALPNTAGRSVIPSATNSKADCLALGTAPTYPALGVVAITMNYSPLESTAIVDLEIPDVT